MLRPFLFLTCLISFSSIVSADVHAEAKPKANKIEAEWGGRVFPYFENKERVGMRVSGIVANGKCAAAGYKDGDIVREFKSKPIVDLKSKQFSVADICSIPQTVKQEPAQAKSAVSCE